MFKGLISNQWTNEQCDCFGDKAAEKNNARLIDSSLSGSRFGISEIWTVMGMITKNMPTR